MILLKNSNIFKCFSICYTYLLNIHKFLRLDQVFCFYHCLDNSTSGQQLKHYLKKLEYIYSMDQTTNLFTEINWTDLFSNFWLMVVSLITASSSSNVWRVIFIWKFPIFQVSKKSFIRHFVANFTSAPLPLALGFKKLW